MSTAPMDPLPALMYQIAQAEPHPWYPKVYAEARGVPRDSLDPLLERLRLLGLVELTEWVANQGQGYRVTGAGAGVLYDRSLLAKLQSGTLAPAAPEQDAPTEANWGSRGASPLERGEAIRAGLLSKERPVVTLVLIGLNVTVFLAGLALAWSRQQNVGNFLWGGDNRIPILTGALTPASLLDGEWWRLVTLCFVHFGLIHLGVNMYSLWILGPLSEKAWGHWRFLALYVVSGLGGSCAMAVGMVTGWELAGASAGASGAIWGLMAGFGVWVFINRSSLGPSLSSTWLRQIGTCVFINLFITFAIPHLSKSGHLGGGLFGAVGAVLLNEQRFAGGVKRWLATAFLVLLPALAVGSVIFMPKDSLSQDPLEAFKSAWDDGLSAFNTSASRFNKAVAPVIQTSPENRDPDKVASALATIGEMNAELSEARAALERLGKNSQPDLEEQREALLDCLLQRKNLFALYVKQLQKGKDWNEADKKAFLDQKVMLENAMTRVEAARP